MVTGVPVHNARRYSNDPRDAAVFMAQLRLIKTAPHRMLVGPEIQAYVEEVLAMGWQRWRAGHSGPVEVRIVHGLTAENGTALYRSGSIYVPPAVEEIIVLHELGHHLSPALPPHGDQFVTVFLDLIERVMNKAAAQTLRECLATEGISA